MLRFRGRDGNSIAADVVGNSDHPPVILLHGGGQTRHAWGEAAVALADEGFFAISLDLRGHGDSEWASDGDYSLGAFAGDILAVAATLSQKPALVGASLGGVTSLIGLGESPEPVARALVLVDVVPKINPEGAKRIAGFMRSNLDGFGSLDEAADAIAAYLPHRPRPKSLSGLNKNLRQRENGRYYWHWDPAFISQDRDINPLKSLERMEQAAPRVKAPTLLVRGSLSEIVDDEGVDAFRKLMPRAEYVTVEGAGHMVAGDKNNAFTDAVLSFLRRHARP